MYVRTDVKKEYPALDYYVRKNIPQLKRVADVMAGLKAAVGGSESAMIAMNISLEDSIMFPTVLVGDDSPRFYRTGSDVFVRWSTAEWFETKSPHTLRGRWGKVYLAGLELLLGTIDMLLYDGKVRKDQTHVFDTFLNRVYGLSYERVLKAHSEK